MIHFSLYSIYRYEKKYRDKKRSLEMLISLKTPKVAATYSHTTSALPSAWLNLTTLFGMGRGGTSAL